jgi:hypothetical protein
MQFIDLKSQYLRIENLVKEPLYNLLVSNQKFIINDKVHNDYNYGVDSIIQLE